MPCTFAWRDCAPALRVGTAPLYVNNTTLGARVASLNPRWNQPSDDATLYQRVGV